MAKIEVLVQLLILNNALLILNKQGEIKWQQ